MIAMRIQGPIPSGTMRITRYLCQCDVSTPQHRRSVPSGLALSLQPFAILIPYTGGGSGLPAGMRGGVGRV